MTIEIRNLNKGFRTIRGRITALQDVSLVIREAEFFVILGPSGCGKSTLLNILAGLEDPDHGEIRFGDRTVASAGERIFVPPRDRKVSMVFQSYALYPHMNVFDNIAFPLRIAKASRDRIKESVLEIAALLDIADLLGSRPRELSGGQRQRVAIGRALVKRPSVLLLDEPLSNLDAQLRVRLREELKNLQVRLKITTVYVTHDQTEAMTLGDRIAILRQGQLQQTAEPGEIYRRPANVFVAGFLGTPPMNLLKGTVDQREGRFFFQTGDLEIPLDEQTAGLARKAGADEITAGIRPEDIAVSGDDAAFVTDAKFVERFGSETLLYFRVNGQKLIVRTAGDAGHKAGDRIGLSPVPGRIHLFDQAGQNLQQ